MSSKYRNGRHVPENLREAFLDAIDAYSASIAKSPTALRHAQRVLHGYCGTLWHCTDIVPASFYEGVCSLLDPVRAPSSRSYAAVARSLRNQLAIKLNQ